MFQTKVAEEIKTRILRYFGFFVHLFIFVNRAVCGGKCDKIL
jgi:hypothetical protein